MDFGLSEDQELLQQSARDFLARECPPAVVRQAALAPAGASDAVERRIAEMGWTGLLVPESYGGLGLGMLDTGRSSRRIGPRGRSRTILVLGGSRDQGDRDGGEPRPEARVAPEAGQPAARRPRWHSSKRAIASTRPA